jgi:gamma-butyrobetaine dioxygenase
MFVNWLPLDAVIERNAAEHRFVIDGGYDLDEDRRVTDAAIATLTEGGHDLALAYLATPDLVGHEHGWDSAEYVTALTTTDAHLARLLAALGPSWSVLVTTDHGGIERNHGDLVPEVLETFVVVRAAGRVSPASQWPAASTLDIAPTVADLCGFDPDPRWEGASLLGAETPIVDLVLERLAATAQESYGERVTMLDHSLQSAALATADDAGEQMVLACLLHDIGHVLGSPGDWGDPGHSEVGARALHAWFDAGIVEPIRGHVDAKRYRVAIDPGYHDHLSLASQMSLAEQGGPFPADQAAAFGTWPFAAEAQQLRAYDDDGKVEGLTIAPLEAYRPMLERALGAERPIDPAWARDACRCPQCRDVGNDQHRIDGTALADWTVVSSRHVDGELIVVLHHRSGERHRCRIPLAVGPAVAAAPWPADMATTLRADATVWGDDTAPFADQLATHGIALFTDCGSARARC